jgi:hypothetical protein
MHSGRDCSTLLRPGIVAQRAGGSAMNMIVIFAAQAAAASVAGVLITRFGHPPVLTVAALLFAGLRSERIAPSDS